ncbi:protein of unknown function (plasmid) [Cupriavidus taiwanensis]|uniref:Uncharacterized protein n=1 Tax=Cupriavidus taiwanensis TaxID=164546 RepID=A0A375FHL4_9BURK|nr:protein of unknown function [Cupriavidus taiwanensis]SOZ72060.1 protein of unknown function [Cupriavidus taiwanensis]SOZ74380.1 protein of unknown function [Cupriavidus taiwanensis]SPA03285.1 protein of unknown function [Cupriavidus taiwanensis]SPA11263.1 protein of unknown function [Cupriavidus taiwanensis]
MTASVTELMNSGDTSVPHYSAKDLDLPHGHATDVNGDDLVIEPGEAPLVLGDQDRIEAAVAVALNVDPQRPSSVSTVLALLPLLR